MSSENPNPPVSGNNSENVISSNVSISEQNVPSNSNLEASAFSVASGNPSIGFSSQSANFEKENVNQNVQNVGASASKIRRVDVPKFSLFQDVHGGGAPPPVTDEARRIAQIFRQNVGTESASLSAKRSPLEEPVRPSAEFVAGNTQNSARDASTLTGKQMQSTVNDLKLPSNASDASVMDSQPLPDRRDSSEAVEVNFSEMSAECLSQAIVSKIQSFDTTLWIKEDISGLAILESVAPADLGEFLERVPKISSIFWRGRIVDILLAMIQRDSTIPYHVSKHWAAFAAASRAKFEDRLSPLPHNSKHQLEASAIMPNVLFQSPVASNIGQTISTPAYFTGSQRPETHRTDSPSFLNEIPSRASFPMSDSSLFSDSSQSRSSVISTLNHAAGIMNSPGHFSITLNQATTNPPEYIILESTSDPAAFHAWLRKNRKETLMARAVDRKPFNELCGQEVREEVGRIIGAARTLNHITFDEKYPFPKEWCQVSDHLLLRILFGLHGPRTSEAAAAKLIARTFHFNDSTTYQSQFVGKLRKFCNEFKTTLTDFAHNYHQWPRNDVLKHDTIRDCFSKCFDNTEMIKGSDGVSMVPKCKNIEKVKNLIKQKKELPLEEIMNHIIDHFDEKDIQIRTIRGLAYDTVPWNIQARGKKRQFNQVAQGGGGRAQTTTNGRPPRPPPAFPRCCNCGSKAHKGDERNCYLWGHPKGKGEKGVWEEGVGPSLRLNPQEWKEWKAIRHAIFYSYPENKGRKPQSS
jgi:hypothetical protein